MAVENKLLEQFNNLLKGVAENYVGKDIRYSSDFEEIENLLSSTTSLFASTTTDWSKIAELSEKILATQSKDLRVLAWFTWAQYKTNSFAGLHAGLFTFNKIIQKCWTELFPQKDRTRISSIEWLSSKIEELFQEPFPVKEQLPLFEALLAELTQFDQFLTDKWQDKSPLLLPTCHRLERMINNVEQTIESEPKSGPVEKVINHVREVVSNTIGSSNTVTNIDNEKEAQKLFRDLQDNSRILCGWWLGQKFADIKALRLNRTLLWLTVDVLPEHKDYITALRPIPVDKINHYKERFKQEHYSDLIVDVENSLSKAPFWLDGHYIIWKCLQSLRMDDAVTEVEIQLALFLKKLPEVIKLKFFDGTAFADEDTVNWINTSVLPWVDKQHNKLNTSNFVATKSSAQECDNVLQECIDNLKHMSFKEVSLELTKNTKKAISARDKFFWQLAMAKLCLAAKKYDLAKIQLENLDEYMHKLEIHKWEPNLELELVFLLYECCKTMPQSQVTREEKELFHKRLCFLDMDLILED